jgi:Protein of unknown function (DUF4231)
MSEAPSQSQSQSQPQTPPENTQIGNSKSYLCCRKKDETERLIQLFSNISELSDIQKKSLEYRYLTILREFSIRCTRYARLFHIGHFIITVGSLIVPALLSVQYADNNVNVFASPQLQAQVYWITWTLSLLVTMFNGILILYKVDKKYYFLHTTRERLRSEGWQYIQLTGRYSGMLMNYSKKATHANQLIAFCYYIERIRMRQIEEEYYKYEETQVEGTAQGDKNNKQNPSQQNHNSIDWNMLYQEIDKKKDEIQNQSPNEVVETILKSLIISSHDKTDRTDKLSKVKPIVVKSNNTASIQTIQDIPASNEVIEPPQPAVNNSAPTS